MKERLFKTLYDVDDYLRRPITSILVRLQNIIGLIIVSAMAHRN